MHPSSPESRFLFRGATDDSDRFPSKHSLRDARSSNQSKRGHLFGNRNVHPEVYGARARLTVYAAPSDAYDDGLLAKDPETTTNKNNIMFELLAEITGKIHVAAAALAVPLGIGLIGLKACESVGQW